MKTQYPFQIIKQRVDIVTRIPAWFARYPNIKIKVGDLVWRINSQYVRPYDDPHGGSYKIGKSYTLFYKYAELPNRRDV